MERYLGNYENHHYVLKAPFFGGEKYGRENTDKIGEKHGRPENTFFRKSTDMEEFSARKNTDQSEENTDRNFGKYGHELGKTRTEKIKIRTEN